MKTSYRKHKRFNITISKSLNDHNLVEKSMILETIINICQVLVMQLNHLPNKNLKKEINFSFQNGINYSKTIQLENQEITCSCKPTISFFSACRQFNIKDNRMVSSKLKWLQTHAHKMRILKQQFISKANSNYAQPTINIK